VRTARLRRAVLWLASTAAVAVAVWVAGRDVLGLPEDENLALFAGAGTAAYAGVLYVLFPIFLQQMALFAALGTAAGGAAGNLPKGEGAASGHSDLGTRRNVAGAGVGQLAAAAPGLTDARSSGDTGRRRSLCPRTIGATSLR
jgi:hypothetical protein